MLTPDLVREIAKRCYQAACEGAGGSLGRALLCVEDEFELIKKQRSETPDELVDVICDMMQYAQGSEEEFYRLIEFYIMKGRPINVTDMDVCETFIISRKRQNEMSSPLRVPKQKGETLPLHYITLKEWRDGGKFPSPVWVGAEVIFKMKKPELLEIFTQSEIRSQILSLPDYEQYFLVSRWR